VCPADTGAAMRQGMEEVETQNPVKKPTGRLFVDPSGRAALAGSAFARIGRPKKYASNAARQKAHRERKAAEKREQEEQAQGYILKSSPSGRPYAVIPELPMSQGKYEDGRRGGFVLNGNAKKDCKGDRFENIAGAIAGRLDSQWAALVAATARNAFVDSKQASTQEDNRSRRVGPKGNSLTSHESGNDVSAKDSSTYLESGITHRELTYLEEMAARNMAIDLSPADGKGPEIWKCPFHSRDRFDSRRECVDHIWEKHGSKVRTAAKNGGSGFGAVHNPRSAERTRKRLKAESVTKLHTLSRPVTRDETEIKEDKAA
jgi:hypothetical protein